ncbi:unnamed protein product [Allacma fusca]|uniref:VWFA and cache domain-containing protein 1 n=1 Tax=Allacma fusca TaxID=39272 RepID=A0A8J2KRK8_9HEXA|nr:unnamed protein product [Allacma fusca]
MSTLIIMCLVIATATQSCFGSSAVFQSGGKNSVGTAAVDPTEEAFNASLSKGSSKLKSNGNNLVNNDVLSAFWKSLRSKSQEEGLQSGSTLMGMLLKKFVEVELGGQRIKDHYTSLPYDGRRSKSLEEQVITLADAVALQLKDYEDALGKLAMSLKQNAEEEVKNPSTSPRITSCCDMKPENLLYDKYFKTQVNKYEACKTIPSKRKPVMFIPNYSFNEVLVDNSIRLPHLKWQYFVSPEGIYVEYPGNSHSCKQNGNVAQPLLSPKGPSGKKLWLIQKTSDDARNHRIVFLIQLGKDTTLSMIKSIKNIVRLLLWFLDESDEVGIVNSDNYSLLSDFLCDQMVPVTSWTRYQIMSYLTYMESKYSRSQSMDVDTEQEENDSQTTANGIQKAINMACTNLTSGSMMFPPSASTIIHLRSGINLEGFDLKAFDVKCPIFLDTFVLKPLNTSEEETYKKVIQGVASKNIYRVKVFSTTQAEPESFAVKIASKLNSKKEWWSLSDILSQFFPKTNEKYTKTAEFSFPHWNPVSKETVIIGKKYVYHMGFPLGLVAVEIPLTYFTQHVTYYVNENTCDGRNYAFMIDKNGRVLSHPALGRPDMSPEILSPIQIDQIEVHRGFASIKKEILTVDRGCQSIVLHPKKSLLTYTWSFVGEFDYVVVLVLHDDAGGCTSYKQDLVLKETYLNPKSDIQHHLLLKDTYMCHKQAISTSKASLYLAPNAFTRPADAINSQLPTKTYSKYPLALMAYIGDNSGFLQNQNRGLKPIVKYHIAALSVSVEKWKFQYSSSNWSRFISRRFATAGGGTFLLTYPGTAITNGYVPLTSTWFRQATTGSRKISFTPPTLDFNSGVPYSTISQVITINVTVSDSPKSEEVPIAVVGADLNVGFFQKILEDAMPECRTVSSSKIDHGNETIPIVSVRCFILDESGYVIYHSQLAKSLKAMTNVHVTQLEPLYVIDMLQYSQQNNGMPMQKQMCHKLSEASATQGSLQRVYLLNVIEDGFVKSKPGEQCSKHKIVPVPETNLFVVMIYDSCSSTAFCPCSTVDNLCLNCLRMEPSDCECPCECPREPSFCSMDNFSDLSDEAQPCEFPGEILPMVQEGNLVCNSSEDAVTNRCNSDCTLRKKSCSKFTTQEDCIGSWDCTWCSNNSIRGENTPKACKTYRECYGYPLSREVSKTDSFSDEYGRFSGSSLADITDEDGEDETGSAVLPALGVLLVFIVFLALVVYCYRHRALSSSNSQPDLHLLPLQESPRCSIVPQAGSSRSDSDGEPFQGPMHQVVDVGNRGRRRQNRFFIPPRSPLGSVLATDSDHGYSTMTPHEDSECGVSIPFFSIDPPPLPPPLSTKQPQSVQTVSSDEPCSSVTELPRVVVPVTVHQELPNIC